MKIGFLDNTQQEYDIIMELLDTFENSHVRDQLGLRSIIDYIGSIFFPGLTYAQKHAKYFIIVPELFRIARKHHITSTMGVIDAIKKMETELVTTLIQNSPKGTKGIIGRNALKQGRNLKRTPATIYWNVLKEFEILRIRKITFAMAASLATRTDSTHLMTDSPERIIDHAYDATDIAEDNFVLFSPFRIEYDLLKEASIILTQKEAEYLKEHILSSRYLDNTLFKYLFQTVLQQKAIPFDSFEEINTLGMTANMEKMVISAQHFSKIISAMTSYYNSFLIEEIDTETLRDKDAFTKITSSLLSWQQYKQMNTINLNEIYSHLNISILNSTYVFIRQFLEADKQQNNLQIRELLNKREWLVKGPKAQLSNNKKDSKSLQLISGWEPEYRFSVAMNIINEIISGLNLMQNHV
ncbi:MAG: DUF6361 family protein [Marinifilaceae bacterium]